MFADNDLEFDETGREFSKRVENTVGKGEIAHDEQFLLFPVFSKDLYCRHVKTRACLGKGQPFYLFLCNTMMTFPNPNEKAFRKHCGKRQKC